MPVLELGVWLRVCHLSSQHAAAVLVDADDDACRLLVQHHEIVQVILAKPAAQQASVCANVMFAEPKPYVYRDMHL